MAKIFLTDSDTNFKIANNGSEIVGTVGIDSVSILEGVTGITLGSGVEEAAFAGDLTSYTFAQKGATLEVFNAAGELVSVLQSAIQQAPTFNGVTLKVERNAEGKMTIANGENVITLEDNAVAVAPPAIDPDAPVDPELPTDEPTEEPVDPADLSVALDAYNTAKTAAKAAADAAAAAADAADAAQALSDDVDSAIADALGKVVDFKAYETAAEITEIKLLPASADFNNLNAEDQATAILNAKNVLKVQVSQKTAELNTANKGPAAKLANAQKAIEGAIKDASTAIKAFGADGDAADSALKAFATANPTADAAQVKVVADADVFSIEADGEVIITTDANNNLIKTSASNDYEAKSVDALIVAANKYLASLDTAETALAAAEKTLTANIDAALTAAKPGLNYFTNGADATTVNPVDAQDVKIKLAELVDDTKGFVKADGEINALADAEVAALIYTIIDGDAVSVALSLADAFTAGGDAVSTTGETGIFAVDADGAITFNDAITTLSDAGDAVEDAGVDLEASVSKITVAINNKEMAIENQNNFNKDVAAWETAKDSKTPLEKAAAAAEAAKEAAELTATEKTAALAAAAEAVNEAAGEGVNVVLEAETGEGEAAVFAGTVSDDLFLFGGDAITITNFNTTGGTDAIYLLGDKEYTLVNVTNEAAIAKADDDAVLQIFAYKEGSNTILAVEDKVYAGTAGEELLTNITLTGVTRDIAFNDEGNLVIA